MSTIVLDTSAVEALRKCGEPAVLRDANGKVVGYFEPAVRVYKAGETPEFDEDELDRREARHDVLSSEEVRRRLGIRR